MFKIFSVATLLFSVITLSAQSKIGVKAGAGVYSFSNPEVKAVSGLSLRIGSSYTYAF